MLKYSYKARSIKGNNEVFGVMEASDERELSKLLREKDLFLIDAKLEKKLISKINISIPFLNKVSLSEKIFFTKNLQVMLSGGLSFPKTLEVLSEQAKSEKFKKVLLDIKEDIGQGKSFSSSLEKYPDIFSEIFRSMVQLSEETGNIEESLTILSKQLEKEYELKSRIKSALIYPIVVISAMFGIAILMLTVVLPQLANIFETMEVDLPASTQFIINLGNFISSNILFSIFLLITLIIVFKLASKTKKGKRSIDFLLLKIPFISMIIKKTNSAHTARTLSSLLSSGVPIIRSLEIVSGNLSNSYYKEAMSSSIEAMKKGGKLSYILRSYSTLYSPLMIQMIEVGEETGQTSEVLSKVADFLEEEVFNITKNLSSTIEPILMVVIGAAVGFFAISMLQPIYSMIGTV